MELMARLSHASRELEMRCELAFHCGLPVIPACRLCRVKDAAENGGMDLIRKRIAEQMDVIKPLIEVLWLTLMARG
jgi:hypothetical protein